MPAENPVVLFDGLCGFCNASVAFIIKHDPQGVFRFAPLQSEIAAKLLADAGWKGTLPDSVMLIEPATSAHSSRVLIMSDASIAIASQLGLPWSLARAARVVPRGVRNAAYKLIARYRYRVFGKRDVCSVPDASVRERFLA